MHVALKNVRALLAASILVLGGSAVAQAEALEASLQSKIDAIVAAAKTWAVDPAVVAAVRARNAATPAQFAKLNQDAWKALTVMDPLVRELTKNEAALALKAKRTPAVAEIFLNAADGTKVAFGAKTTSWSHAGKAKHDVPMSGGVWQGDVELDESTGLKQLQVAVPVLDGDKAIGSLVVGLSLSKL